MTDKNPSSIKGENVLQKEDSNHLDQTKRQLELSLSTIEKNIEEYLRAPVNYSIETIFADENKSLDARETFANTEVVVVSQLIADQANWNPNDYHKAMGSLAIVKLSENELKHMLSQKGGGIPAAYERLRHFVMHQLLKKREYTLDDVYRLQEENALKIAAFLLNYLSETKVFCADLVERYKGMLSAETLAQLGVKKSMTDFIGARNEHKKLDDKIESVGLWSPETLRLRQQGIDLMAREAEIREFGAVAYISSLLYQKSIPILLEHYEYLTNTMRISASAVQAVKQLLEASRILYDSYRRVQIQGDMAQLLDRQLSGLSTTVTQACDAVPEAIARIMGISHNPMFNNVFTNSGKEYKILGTAAVSDVEKTKALTELMQNMTGNKFILPQRFDANYQS